MRYSYNINLSFQPENLYLTSTSSDEVKVIDFGCARLWRYNRALKVKYGNPEYVAPEVAAEDNFVTPAADLWSVGVILYIL